MSKVPDVVTTVQEEIATDTQNMSERLIDLYNRLPASQRGVMDAVLVELCGWSFPSLVALARQRECYLEVQDA